MGTSYLAALAAVGLVGVAASFSHAAPAFVLGDDNALVGFDTLNPGTSLTSVFLRSPANAAIEDLVGIDYRPSNNQLYGVGRFGAVYTINTTSGVSTQVTSLTAAPASLDPTSDFNGLVGSRFGFDFNPVPDRLRIVSNADQNLRINVDNGATITDGTLNPGNPTITAAAYTNPDNNTATGTQLYYIDTGSSSLFTTSAPNDGTVTLVGPLGFSFSNLTGFDIQLANGVNSGFAALQRTDNGTTELYSINLTTGTAALLGEIGGGDLYDGLAIAIPEPATLGVLGGAAALLLRRRR